MACSKPRTAHSVDGRAPCHRRVQQMDRAHPVRARTCDERRARCTTEAASRSAAGLISPTSTSTSTSTSRAEERRGEARCHLQPRKKKNPRHPMRVTRVQKMGGFRSWNSDQDERGSSMRCRLRRLDADSTLFR